MRIVAIREHTQPIASLVWNAFIDFSTMTTSLVAVITDIVRDGRRVVGYGFNSNGRYGQGGLIRERFAPCLLTADPENLLNDAGDNLDPDRIWNTMMRNEKPGGHGERSVAVGTIDMAVWDAVAKIAGKPLFCLLAERHGMGLPFCIADAQTNDPLGFIGLWPDNLSQGRARLGYWVIPAARGRGIASSALHLLSTWTFEALSVVRLELVIELWNTASQRVAEQAGFVREGVLRSYMEVNGIHRNVLIYACIVTPMSQERL